MNALAYAIRELTSDDVDACLTHFALLEASRLSAREEEPSLQTDLLQVRDRMIERWAAPMGSPVWRRTFGLWFGRALVGAADLCASVSDRCELGVAIEPSHRGKGWGRSLIEEAIRFAADASVECIDLAVLDHNRIARSLYEKLGFVERGRNAETIFMTARIQPRSSACLRS